MEYTKWRLDDSPRPAAEGVQVDVQVPSVLRYWRVESVEL
jgi:hypothetical protein